MSFIAPVQTSKPSMITEVGEVGVRQPYNSRPDRGRLLVAFAKVDHTYHLAACFLPGNAGDKMIGLKKWRYENTGRWQAVAAFLLCKKTYITVGRLGVSLERPIQAK
jgi:hypothetical protein